MSEANADASGEMVKWTTPDGTEVEVRATPEQLKELEGVNERFSNLTKSEQDLSMKEKSLAKQIEDAQEQARDAAWDDLDEEAYKLLGVSKGWTAEEAAEAAAAGEGDANALDPMAEIDKIKAELADRDEQSKAAQEQAEYKAAEQEVANEIATAADANESFAGLFSDHWRSEAYAKTWEVLEESNFNTSTEDAVQAGIEFATALQNETIEAHAQSKKSGPGAPGTAAGEMERPESFADDNERNDHMLNFVRRLKAQDNSAA